MPTQPAAGGRHVIADLSGAAAAKLRDAEGLMACLEDTLRRLGFHVLDSTMHKFSSGGEGFTGVVLLSESHAALHTYPEAGYVALDIFSCGRQDAGSVVDAVTLFVDAQEVNIRRVSRAPAVSASPSEFV